MPKRMLAALKQPSLKLTLIAIVFVVLVPTLGVVTATLYSASRSYHDASTRQLLETARTVARSTFNELELTGSVLPHLAANSTPPWDERAASEVDSFAQGQLTTYRLDDSSGVWRMSPTVVLDATIVALVEKAAQTGRMQVSDILMPSGPGQPMRVVVAMPHGGEGVQQLVSTLVTQPQHLLHALSSHADDSTSVILAITDGQGRIIDRSVDGERLVGKPVPDWEILSRQAGDSGSFLATTLEREQIIFAFQRIPHTPGWVAVVGESARSFNQRVQKPIWVMLSAAAVTICLALLLALLLARKAIRPIQLLAARAQRIAASHTESAPRLMADVPPSFVAEFEVLRQSLDQADQALQHSLQESRRAEQEAQTHLAVLQTAEEQARLGHWALDGASGALHCSAMISVLFGGPREPLVIKLDDLRARLTPESYERMRAAASQCLHKGITYAMEVEHLRSDGSVFAAYLRGWPVRNAQQQVMGISGTLQDISEGKEQNERLVALADNLPSGVIFRLERHANQSLTLQFLSAGLEVLTGYTSNTLLHSPQTLLRAIAPVHLRRMLRVLKSAQQPGDVLDAEFALRTAYGGEIWIHCRAALRYPGVGGAVWDGIARDVTAERAADEALRHAKEVAEQAERAKSDFLATMSHEIRTPMNSVIGMARLAMHTQLDDQQRNYLNKINESANVLLGIINDILDFSKIEAGGMVLERRPFRLEEVLDTVAAVTVLRAEEKGLEITYAIDPSVPATVCGDALRLGQVLTNLVSNAVKFTEAGDVMVRVSPQAAAQGALLCFEVTDTGIGLTDSQISHLFQPFTQAQSDTTRRYGGTGLGLAISQRLVHMMGGTMGVRSQHGQGSTFFFTVRMDAVAPLEAEQQALAAQERSLRGRRILIADDNRMARMALAEMAQGFGMRTTLATNGQEAVQVLRRYAARGEAFEMVVLDWRMPVMDGLEAARLIKADGQLGPMPAVLMVTAYGQDAMLQASQGMDLQGVLLKPVTQSAMFNTLHSAISGAGVPVALHSKPSYQPVDISTFEGLRGKRVLVADDNALNREVATDFLRHVGVQVFTAVDGEDAIRCLEAQPMDAVLMDIHMPNMDGLTATRAIRRRAAWQHLPIIALTAQARGEDVQSSQEAGMNGHLSKPIDEALLYCTLLAHCKVAHCQVAQGEVAHGTPTAPPAAPAKTTLGFARLSSNPTRQAQLLRGFLQDFTDVPQHFAHWLAQSQWVQIADRAHQIKGSASYLDATALCELADAVELAARQQQAEQVAQHAPAFVAHVQACLDEVAQALQALDRALAPSTSLAAAMRLTRAQVLSLIAPARPLVEQGNFAAHALLQALVQGAAGWPWAPQAQAALQAFDDLECEHALALLDAIAQQCREGGPADH